MPWPCFLIEHVMDCWTEAGEPRIGAMVWRNHVPDEHDEEPRPFPHLGVMTPAGLACLDCPESDPPYGKWARTGEPPAISVTPSLNVNDGQWHGYLRDGVLVP